MSLLNRLIKRLRGEPNLKKLEKRGLKIGNNFKMMGECIIDPSHCWHIEIGNNVILAPRVHILAHDASTKLFLNYTKVAKVRIGNNVFVGAGSIVLPGVSIGNNVVIGTGSVISKDIPNNSVAIGVPAKVIGDLHEYLEKEKDTMNSDNCFDETYTLRNKKLSQRHKDEMIKAIKQYSKIFVD